jgi:micrococcal nuclease
MKKIVVSSIILILLCSLSLFGDTIVYVTNSGKKYHRDGCNSLSRSKIEASLEDALRSGYEACGVCNPPVISRANDSSPKELYHVHKANLLKTTDAQISRMIGAEVVGHIDGDTIRVRIANPPKELKTVETIRMLGIDTPETVHPNKPVEYFGMEASAFTKARLLGKQVYLAFDWDLRDHYGRLLAYVYTQDRRCFNAFLIQEGYAYAYSTYPFQFKDEFEALERAAQSAKRGLWENTLNPRHLAADR